MLQVSEHRALPAALFCFTRDAPATPASLS